MGDQRATLASLTLLLLVICSVDAQVTCYQCFGLGAQNPLLAQTAAQYPISSCSDIGPRTPTIDCSGKCFTQNFTVNYNFQQATASINSLDVDYLILGCGADTQPNGCTDFANLPNIDEVRQQTENVVAQFGGRVNTMRGDACFCPRSRCNAAAPGASTSAGLLGACIASITVLAMVLGK